MSHNREDIAEAHIRVLEEQVRDIEAQVQGLEADLHNSQNTMGDLDLRIKGHEAKLVEKEYAANLEGQLARATSKVFCLEVQIHCLQV